MKKSSRLVKTLFGTLGRLFLIGFLLFLALPRFSVNQTILGQALNSTVGGYNLNLPSFEGPFPSSPYYALGDDFFPVNVVHLSPVLDGTDIGPESVENADGNLPLVVPLAPQDISVNLQILSARLSALGYPSARVSYNEEPPRFEVYIPSVGDLGNKEARLLTQPGRVTFRQLQEGVEWNEQNLQDYYLNLDLWDEPTLSSDEILGAVAHLGDVQLILSEEGHEVFRELVVANVGKPLGIFIDASPVPVALPLVTEALADSEGPINPVIEDSLDEESAEILAIQQNTGILTTALSIDDSSLQYAPPLTTGVLYTTLAYLGIGLGLFFLVMLILFRLSAFIALISYVCFVLFVGAFLRMVQIPLDRNILYLLGFLFLVTLLRQAWSLLSIRSGLKKGKPANLAVYQALFAKTKEFRVVSVGVSAFVLGVVLVFPAIPLHVFNSFLFGLIVHTLVYRYVFYPLLMKYRSHIR